MLLHPAIDREGMRQRPRTVITVAQVERSCAQMKTPAVWRASNFRDKCAQRE